MINYDLAMKLKEAGFPQEWSTPSLKVLAEYMDDAPFFPTLSELIQACGEGFVSLSKTAKDPVETAWRADGIIFSKEPQHVHVYAQNPQEAVAKLWLKVSG